jgi:anti-sigma B factor antagonist
MGAGPGFRAEQATLGEAHLEVRIPGTATAAAPYVVEVGGDIDIATVAGLEEPVISAIQEGRRPVVLDLCECVFIDSSGIRLLLRAHRLLHPEPNHHRPSLAVVALGHVASMLEITAVDKVIPVRASRAEAEAAVTGRT